MSDTEIKNFTIEEVAKHNNAKDLWIILGEGTDLKVYDLTKYHKGHPGGADVMVQNAGTNAQNLFEAAGHSDMALSQMKKFCIGNISNAAGLEASASETEQGDTKKHTQECNIM